nr:MAG TPA: minor structural protein GP20 [Caudoviricetes sp.]
MKLKLDDQGHAVLQDGKPVYVHDDGKEIPFDAPEALNKISALNAEAKRHREDKEAVQARLKAFDGIEDAAAAKKALETVKNLDDKKLIDAGEAERVKAETVKSYEEKLAAANAEAEKIRTQFHQELIGGSFARSQVIADKLAIPADVAQAFFGRHFGISEDGRIVAKDANGNEIYSRIKPGEKAGFDEALEALIDAYPHKDSILKGSQASGGGTGGSSGAGNAPKSLAECKTDADRIAYLQAKNG